MTNYLTTPYHIGIKLLITIVISFILSQTAKAQFPEYAVGVRAGADWSMALFEPAVAQPQLPTTWHAGAQFRMVSEKYFGIVVELNYMQKGFSTAHNNIIAHRRLDYIELPFLSHITFGRKLFRYFINAGPCISYLINDVQNHNNSATEHTLPIKNRFDYGIVAGTGFEFNTKYGIYTIDARYGFGLGNIFSSKASDTFKSSSNQSITVSLAYLFPL